MSKQDIRDNLSRFSSAIDALRRTQHSTPDTEEAATVKAMSDTLHDLSLALEELQVAEEELRQQNEELEASRLHLEEERHRYLDLFEFAPNAYFVTAPDSTIREANRAAAQLLHITPRFLIGKPLAAFVEKSERKAFRTELLRLNAESRLDEWEVRLVPRAGVPFDALITVEVERGIASDTTSLRWMIRDVTEHKRHVDHITNLNALLEQHVQERTAELKAETQLKEEALQKERAAREEAEHANALKLQFLAMISHELRTPLTTIKGFASTLLAEDIKFSEEDQRDFIGLIEEESDRLTELVEQLIDLARLKAGTLRVNTEARPLQSIARMAHARMETLAANHRLIIDLPDDAPRLIVDAQRVAQVLVNLVGNAAKFSPPGTDIRLRVTVSAAEVQFDVEDEGPGIPPEKHTLVFEAFRQLEPGSTGRRGAGLGLAICKELVEAQGGRIWVANTLPTGTRISFTLPLAP